MSGMGRAAGKHLVLPIERLLEITLSHQLLEFVLHCGELSAVSNKRYTGDDSL